MRFVLPARLLEVGVVHEVQASSSSAAPSSWRSRPTGRRARPAFEAELVASAPGLLRELERQPILLLVEADQALLHPAVELGPRELALQVGVHHLRVRSAGPGSRARDRRSPRGSRRRDSPVELGDVARARRAWSCHSSQRRSKLACRPSWSRWSGSPRRRAACQPLAFAGCVTQGFHASTATPASTASVPPSCALRRQQCAFLTPASRSGSRRRDASLQRRVDCGQI